MQKHVVIITSSRAEWGLLYPVYCELKKLGIRTSVLATGSHLHSQSGFSVNEIEQCDVKSVVKVYITPEDPGLTDDQLMFRSMANAIVGLPEALQQLQPDLAIVLGDRYEILAAALTCRLSGIRLAHISGGELTLGAFDDQLRHCITKLSDIHFTATGEYRRRVIQLGENPGMVYNVGELALSGLSRLRYKNIAELEAIIQRPLKDFFLLTVHPETCSPGAGLQIVELLLDLLPKEFSDTLLLFTAANADPEGNEINAMLAERAVCEPSKIHFVKSLGRLNYLSAARYARCVIGNSSSGIAEIPAVGTPVVNIGRRQLGRPHGRAVISVACSGDEIVDAVKKAADPKFREVIKSSEKLYAGEDAAVKISEIIALLDFKRISREKVFFDC